MAELKIKADSGGGTVSLKGPATTTSNAAVQLTLPVDDGTSGQYLKTDGSGALSWATVAVGGATGTDYNDDVKVRFGTGNDLQIYHTGSQSRIENSGTGELRIQGDTIQITDKEANDMHIQCVHDGAVQLYHDNTKQCERSANGLAFPSGKGIDFSATADGTGSSQDELLADYEHGKWSPSCKSDGTINGVVGEYIRVGNLVWIYGYINTISNQTAGNTIQIEGLPFTVETNHGSGWESKGGAGGCMALQCSNDPAIQCSYANAGDHVEFGGTNSGSWHMIKHSHFNHTNAMVMFTMTYTTS